MMSDRKREDAARAADLLSAERLASFSALIDVRSPSEFAEDHIPGAVNLPVLDDAERARVGALYVRTSKFEARKIGAALVSRNIARHLESALADMPPDFAPMVYCWRGGQRSGAMALVLAQIGWRAATLPGGYRAYRGQVVSALYDAPFPCRVALLDGDTGVAKTEILSRLAARGVQVLDLEGLAAHRGSVFGAVAAAQPSQKMLESRIWAAVRRLDPGRPVVIEAESSKIGERLVPPTLWTAMATAPRIVLRAPIAARARYLAAAYADVAADGVRLDALLTSLVALHGQATIAAWRRLAAAGAHQALAAALIEQHYDPRYARARRRAAPAAAATIEMADLAATDQEAAADAVAQAVASL